MEKTRREKICDCKGMMDCAICGSSIPAMRRELAPRARTCSAKCSAALQRLNHKMGQRRRRAAAKSCRSSQSNPRTGGDVPVDLLVAPIRAT